MTQRVKILCVRARPNPDTATMLHNVVDEWVHALALHCDVEMIEQDFDLIEVYERVKPDFLLFDSIHWGRRHRLSIANIDAYPDLPRALFLNCDPHDPMRPLTMDMLAAYGIDTIFCMGIETQQQMIELRRFANCFILPKFIDAAVFRDYGEARVIPVTIMSAHLFPSFYPWRALVTTEIQQVMPTLLYTHPGYGKSDNPFEIRDESYARMLSRSQFCVADTTVLDYVVRKHLEIPAAGSILVSPPSAALDDYGFVDGENCLLGEAGPDLYRKMLAVARDPIWYEQIRSKGQALVHDRYTRESWTGILDWFACRRDLKPGERVQQDGVFGAFRAVPDSNPVANSTIHDNPMGAKLRAAREALLTDGSLSAAVEGLKVAMSWIGHVGEPWFLMGVIALAIGDLDNAAKWLSRRSAAQGHSDSTLGLLDPCEIAWLLLFAHITGDDELMVQMSECAAATSHVNIRRVQWLALGAPAVDLAEAGLEGPLPGDCLSIHWLGDEDFHSWAGLMQRIIAANGGAVVDEAA